MNYRMLLPSEGMFDICVSIKVLELWAKPKPQAAETSFQWIIYALMAEREGFEPSIRCRIHTFQACAFDHSAISPQSSRSL